MVITWIEIFFHAMVCSFKQDNQKKSILQNLLMKFNFLITVSCSVCANCNNAGSQFDATSFIASHDTVHGLQINMYQNKKTINMIGMSRINNI